MTAAACNRLHCPQCPAAKQLPGHQARLARVVFGALDAKAGAMGSLYNVHEDARLNHRVPVTGGVLADDSVRLLRDFFKQRR